MRLGADNLKLVIGKLPPIPIRPSLRAAHTLEQQHGFAVLFQKANEGSLTALLAIARANGHDIEAQISGMPLSDIVPPNIGTVSEYICSVIGLDEPPNTDQPGKRLSFHEYHRELFKIATGWLGWSPEQTWDATPAEILAAYDGHVAMLRAIHGGKDESQANPQNTQRDRAGLMSLKGHGHAV